MVIQPGTMVGPYRIHSLLGEGGMGAVYYGEHVVLGRPAAIKVLLPHIAQNTGLVQRFVNEARIAAAMKHRNVVDVLDCGMFPGPDVPGAQWFIALEYLHGKSLGKMIAERGGQPFDLPTIVHIVGEAANGLHAAHEKHNLVHRDVKPDNLFIVQEDEDPYRVKTLDFGIAKLRQPGHGGMQTQSQTGMGTPAYAAPEQLREAAEVDRRADVWALGVVAYEMATGVRPWGATTSVWQIIAHHTEMKKAPDPRDVRPDLPKKFARVISKAMEPDPDRRWKTAKDFVRALAEATQMPFSGTAMVILEKYAPEIAKSTSHSLTVGRPLPAEVRADAAAIATAPERPVAMQPQPLTISDGVPRAPGTAPAAGHSPISTLSASSGQMVAPATPRRRRRALIAAGAGVGAAGIAVVVAFAISGGGEGGEPEPRAAAAATVDAAAAPPIDAARATSALAIVTEPGGATIFVNGVAKGASPINLQLPVGDRVDVRAELDGYSPTGQAVTVEATPGTVRLALARVVDAGVPPDASPPVAVPAKDDDHGSRRGKRRPRGTGKGTGSSSEPGFNPNDVL
jgi:serine/threonine-protein kinase